MKFLSVCSGIEAASVAWEPLGWKPVLYSEIEKFPRAVLKARQRAVDASETGASKRGVPLWGDFTAIRPRHFDRLGIDLPDVLVGGTPCQAFSIAGLRRSLDDARGNLSLSFVRLANAIDNERKRRNAPPLVVTWENVPGVLSTKDNAFGCFLGALAGSDAPLVPPAGGKWRNSGLVVGPRRSLAWRVLDAQHFGVPQRRRRVFVIASARRYFDPGAVLFELQGLRGDIEAGRKTGSPVAALTSCGVGTCGADDNQGQAGHLIPAVVGAMSSCGGTAKKHGQGWGQQDWEDGYCIPHHTTGAGFWQEGLGTLRAREQDSHENVICMATGQASAEIGIGIGIGTTLNCNHEAPIVTHTLRGEGFDASEDGTGRGTPLVPVAFSCKDYGADAGATSPTLRAMGFTGSHANGGGQVAVAMRAAVRRLIPRECERLQGFPDDYTLIAWGRKPREDCPDGPRYKALGNSMAVPVMHWIGARIQMVIDYFGRYEQ